MDPRIASCYLGELGLSRGASSFLGELGEHRVISYKSGGLGEPRLPVETRVASKSIPSKKGFYSEMQFYCRHKIAKVQFFALPCILPCVTYRKI
jgi:hypothetical protein